MQKNLFSLALTTAALTTLVGCSDNKLEKQTDMQARYQSLIKDSIALSQTGNSSLKVELTAQDYTQAEDSAQATDQFLISLFPYGDSLRFTQESQISYPDVSDTLGMAVSHLSANAEDLKALGMNTREAAALNRALAYLSFERIFRKKGQVTQNVKIKPIALQMGLQKFDYAGFTLSTHFKQKDIKHFPFAAQGTFDSGALNATAKDKNTFNDISLSSFTGTYETQQSGTFHSESTPIKFSFLPQDGRGAFVTNIKSFVVDGKNIKFDEKIKQYLGNYDFSAQGLTFQGEKLNAIESGKEIVFKNITISQGTEEESNGFYQSAGAITFSPETNIPEIFGINDLMINEVHMGASLTHLNTETLNLINEFYTDPDNIAAFKDAIVKALGTSKPALNVHLRADTEQGKALADFSLQLIKLDEQDIEDWITASQTMDSEKLTALLDKNVNFSANIVIPKALARTTGYSALIEMYAGPYLEDDGSNYTVNAKIENGQILINGQKIGGL